EVRQGDTGITNHNHIQSLLRTPLFAPLVAYALEIQVRHGQWSGASDIIEYNEASRPQQFLTNQNIEQFVLSLFDKLPHERSNSTDLQATSPLRPALFDKDYRKQQFGLKITMKLVKQ
ncbi:MAG: hypothetical protein EZS28_050642, partial [Streblomastix strix]